MKKIAYILLVEDDSNLGYVIKDNLEVAGYNVYLCQDGEAGLELFKKYNFDLCILDVMLPKKDGFAVAEQIRRQNQQIPVLFLTAKSMKEDKIAGFKAGGDDYITKPFSMEELLLRIEVFLKRTKNHPSSQNVFEIGEYNFDYSNLALSRKNKKILLTQKEADVLRMLCLNKDKVLKREEILKAVWGNNDYFLGRSMDVFISRIRRYLKDDKNVEIVNIHSVGFKLEEKK